MVIELIKRYNIVIFSCFFQTLFGQEFKNETSMVKNNDRNNFTIHIERSFKPNCVIIFLLEDGKKIDSLKLSHLDFVTDSLIEHENNWWEYIVSSCTACSSNKYIEQFRFLFLPRNGKLQISYFDNYKLLHELAVYPETPQLNEKWEPDSSKEFGILKQRYGEVYWIKLDSGFFQGNYTLSEVYLEAWANGSMQNKTKRDKKELIRKYVLNFDEKEGIFFTHFETLDGSYKYRTESNKTGQKVTFENKKVHAIFIYPYTSVYFDDKWYFLNFGDLVPIMARFVNCGSFNQNPNACD